MPEGKGDGKNTNQQDGAQQLELNDYSRKGMPTEGQQGGMQTYQRLGGRRDGMPLGDYGGRPGDDQKEQIQRYSARLSAQTKQQQQLDDLQSRQQVIAPVL